MKILKRIKRIFKGDWVEFETDSETINQIDDIFKSTFNFRNIILSFVEFFFSFIISAILEEPIIALAHYIRTFEWIYKLEIWSFLIYLGMIFAIIFGVYILSKPLRKKIQDEVRSQKRYLVSKIISISFALLVVDVVLDYLFAISYFIPTGKWELDTGLILDKIIASILLLLAILIGYYIKHLYKKVRKD